MTHIPRIAVTTMGPWCWCFAALVSAQAPTVVPSPAAQSAVNYDVVSIRLVGADSTNYRGMKTADPDGIEIILPLRDLLSYAYDTRPEFIFGGPRWVDSTVFDIKAKVDEEDIPLYSKLSPVEKGSMLVPVLASRFGLKVHSEVRQLAVYDLIVEKNGALGPQFTPHPADNSRCSGGASLAEENFEGHEFDMTLFTKILSHILGDTIGRPIVDKTGLKGCYDFRLTWRPLDIQGESMATRPDIFTAVKEQLGLKLQPAKEPIPAIAIDSVEMPSDN